MATILDIGGLQALQLELFDSWRSIFWHGSFTRRNGISPPPFDSLNTSVSTSDSPENVRANRQKILGSISLPNVSLFVPELSHGVNIALIDDSTLVTSPQSFLPNTDAILTRRSKLALMISTADCNPIFYFDKKHHLIGLAHAGWKGLAQRLPALVIQAILDSVPTSPENISVAVGPSIGPCCYKLRDPAQKQFADWQKYLTDTEGGLTSIDLWTPVEDQLLDAGVPAGNIQVSRICTACNDQLFFSYWTGKPNTGRFASVIAKI